MCALCAHDHGTTNGPKLAKTRIDIMSKRQKRALTNLQNEIQSEQQQERKATSERGDEQQPAEDTLPSMYILPTSL
jgi:hypothetical protein